MFAKLIKNFQTEKLIYILCPDHEINLQFGVKSKIVYQGNNFKKLSIKTYQSYPF